MQFNNYCPKCGTPTWANHRADMIWHSGKRFYDLNRQVVGIKMASGLVFCQSCFEHIQSNIDENDMAGNSNDDGEQD